jgi:hypothetical protein
LPNKLVYGYKTYHDDKSSIWIVDFKFVLYDSLTRVLSASPPAASLTGVIMRFKKGHPSCRVVAESGARSAILKDLEEKLSDPSYE